ncbi:MAG: TolC family protein [Prolixibacteraceae bacterium]|nr:TolC family protein [Prolixibacteraceae bacterium]
MRKYLSIPALFFLIVLSPGAQSQEVWPLQKCINYALENNIQVKQGALSSDYYGNELDQAKNNRLPNLNAYMSNDMSYGRSLSYDNTYQNVNSNNAGGSLSSSVTLWNGSILSNQVKKAELDLKASMEDLQKAKDDIMLNIAAAYLEILFADELVTVAADQMGVTRLQIDRTSKLVDAGSLAKGSLLEIEAQLAREELQLVNEQNRLQLAYLNLYQLLELPSTETFKIEKPSLPMLGAGQTMINSMDIFKTAADVRPEIKSAEYKLKSAEKQLEIAKGYQYPTLSFGANYYNSYNNKYKDGTGNNIPLSDQIKNNERYGFGFDLSIPIFNRRQVRNGISNATIQKTNLELQLQSAKNLLRKDIEQAYTNALAALKRYMANEKAVVSMSEAFRYTEEKFTVGMVNSVEYNQSKNNLTKAKSDLLQAKYEYIFRTKILDFYAGKPIEL